MTHINKNNYEIFFIDYYDGNLSAEQSAELFLFLESHPDLKVEFDNFSNVQLEIPEMQFPDRDSLKRGEISQLNINDQLIAAMEGDQAEEEKQALNVFMQLNPGYEKDAKLFQSTISAPDLSIVYPDKKSLKKPVPFFAAYKNEIRYGIAAMLLLAFIAGMVSVFNRTMNQTEIQVAEKHPAPIQNSNKTGTSVETAGVNPSQNSHDTVIENPVILPKSVQQNSPITNEEKANKNRQPKSLKNIPDVEQQVSDAGPVLMAEVISAKPVPSASPEMHLIPNDISGNRSKVTHEIKQDQYITVWEALRQSSEKNLRKAVGKQEETFAYADENQDQKVRLVDVLSKGVEKFTNDKAKLESTYNSDKQSNGFSFSMGNLRIEKK